MTYANIDDLRLLWRAMTQQEEARAEALMGIVSAELRSRACRVGIDLDARVTEDEDLMMIAKSVVCDVVGRALMTSTSDEPMSQFAESANGYTQSGTYLVPGGGLFIKNSELSRLGIKRQRYGGLSVYD